MSPRTRLAALACAASLSVTACTDIPAKVSIEPSASPSSVTQPSRSTQPVDPSSPIVIAISVDGLNPRAIAALGAAVPSFRRLAVEGASTRNARTAYEQTDTLPNHASMLTGRPIDGPAGHHLTFNRDDGSWLEALNTGYVPGIFDVAHDNGLTTALYTSKAKFRVLIRSWDANHGAADVTGKDDGHDKLDTALLRRSSAPLVRSLIHGLRSAPTNLSFLHLAEPDLVGHQSGFMGPEYLDAVVEVDHFLGRILTAVSARPELRDRTTVIVTADHGGDGVGHRMPDDPDNYTIPFYVWGVGVAAGADLYALNPARADPAGSRPGYHAPQPIRNLDLAQLSLSLLGLPGLPPTAGAAEPHPLTVN